jgi:hypothetical protein
MEDLEKELQIASAVNATKRGRRPGEADPGPAVEAKPEKEYEEVTVDLPPHAPDVRIDGRVFHPGMVYKVTKEQATTMKDIMARAWAHEQEVRGQRTGFAPKPRNHILRG